MSESDNQNDQRISRYEAGSIISEVEKQVLSEDKLGVGRDEVVRATCQRIRRRLREYTEGMIEDTKTCFTDCPKCDGELHYPTGMGDCICQDCGAEYLHEKRTTQHLLWVYDDDYHVDEVVDRAK